MLDEEDWSLCMALFSFSWSDCACNHPSCRRTWRSSSPCCCVQDNHGVDHLDDDSLIGDRHGCVSCFDGSCNIYDYNDAGNSIHGYAQQNDEPFSFPLADSCPWQSF